MTTWGVTEAGFRAKMQQDIIDDINTALKAVFGANINLGAESVFGQLVGVFSEREALLWALAEAVYASQYPGGAEGTSVDNILALNNLVRLKATPTVTDPTPTTQPDGVVLYGLVLYGEPGTVIPAGSQVKTTTVPPLTFTLDADVTINGAVNGEQNIVLSNAPTQGNLQLGLISPSGNVLKTGIMPWNTMDTSAVLSWTAAPTGTMTMMLGDQVTEPLTSVEGPDVEAAVQALGGDYAGVYVSGGTGESPTDPAEISMYFGNDIFNPMITVAPRLLTRSDTVTGGAFTLTIGATATTSMPFNVSAADMQTAIRATGHPRALVGTTDTGWAINFVGETPPAVVVSANTLTGPGGAVSLASTSGYAMSHPATVAQSMQAEVSNLYDPDTGELPFADVMVYQSGSLFSIYFGANSQDGLPSSAERPQPAVTIPLNTLQASGETTNVAVATVASGAPSRGTGTATCTVTGPNEVLAGQLSVIATATAGWTAVTNELDCLPGTNVETDTDALVRRSQLASSQARGPLQGIVERVLQVPGVSGAVGFSNNTAAALQTLQFATIPTSGTFQLVAGGGTTAPIPYSATASTIQNALSAIAGYAPVTVAGGMALGFIIDFNGSNGGQWQPLMQVVNNTTGIAAQVTYGRPPKSLEIVAQGGSAKSIAEAIYGAMPAGIASYGTPAAQTLGTLTQASTSITVASAENIEVGQGIFGLGISAGASVAVVAGTAITMTAPALGTYSNTPLLFNHSAQVTDEFGNPVTINFSRPTAILFYVNVALVTDQYRTPGDPSSGANPTSKFSPASIARIQSDIARIGNTTPIGGLVIGFGTNGLVGAFNEVPGIVGYSITFGVEPEPVTTANVQLLPTQVATFQNFNIKVAWS